ncbi:MAG: fused MFS/spermidine synthase [Deltaproteobacteria bacterium]|jgi:spermidine synthase|nr:fused MFS/spermidine synthase [Deltaproteobacteria bacterium]
MSDEAERKEGWLRPLWRGLAGSSRKSQAEVIFEGDSVFHHVTITQKDGIRTLRLGPQAEEAETSMSVANPETPVFEYPGMMFLGLALGPRNKNILMLGLGGGYIPNLFRHHLPEHRLTVVEVDPLVAELAATYFGFAPGGNVGLAIADGLEFVSGSADGAYDQIWLDAFNGHYIPDHLCGLDFLSLLRLKLAEGGLAIQNLHQTAWLHFRSQLENTVKVFGRRPLLFSGTRCANTVSMSLNSDEDGLPMDKAGIARMVKAFRPRVGPYDLMEEADKLEKTLALAL